MHVQMQIRSNLVQMQIRRIKHRCGAQLMLVSSATGNEEQRQRHSAEDSSADPCTALSFTPVVERIGTGAGSCLLIVATSQRQVVRAIGCTEPYRRERAVDVEVHLPYHGSARTTPKGAPYLARHCRRNMVGSPPRGVPVVVDYR